MSQVNYSRFFEHTRALLSPDGNPLSEKPAEDILRFHAPDALDAFLAEYPCASNWEAYEEGTRDYRAFSKAVGAKLAEVYAGTPGGCRFVAQAKQIKLGPVTKTVEGRDPESVKADARAAMVEAVKNLSCIQAQASAAPPISLFSTAGRSRSLRGCR